MLPTQAIAERYDIVVDFAKNGIKPGDKLYFVNIDGARRPASAPSALPLADVLSEKYKAVLKTNSDGTQQWDQGDPVVGKFMRAAGARPTAGTDLSMNPADYEPAKPARPPARR